METNKWKQNKWKQNKCKQQMHKTNRQPLNNTYIFLSSELSGYKREEERFF